MKPSTCHPDRKHFAKGMCYQCYQAEYRKKMDPEVKRAYAKKYEETHAEELKVRRKAAYDADPSKQLARTRKYEARHPERVRLSRLAAAKAHAVRHLTHAQRQSGWTVALTEEYWDKQAGLCAICSVAMVRGEMNGMTTMHRDHDHATLKPRALLCQRCNTGLGKYEKWIKAMAPKFEEYLARHSSRG
jgi:hypothetical protein